MVAVTSDTPSSESSAVAAVASAPPNIIHSVRAYSGSPRFFRVRAGSCCCLHLTPPAMRPSPSLRLHARLPLPARAGHSILSPDSVSARPPTDPSNSFLPRSTSSPSTLPHSVPLLPAAHRPLCCFLCLTLALPAAYVASILSASSHTLLSAPSVYSH
jgi:hypothetical protein